MNMHQGKAEQALPMMCAWNVCLYMENRKQLLLTDVNGKRQQPLHSNVLQLKSFTRQKNI
jgi:hypothetical protein